MNSPFLYFASLELEGSENQDNNRAIDVPNTPFLASPQLNGKKIAENPKAEQFVQIMDELYDEEFEESIEDLLNEADDLRESYVQSDRYISNEYQSQSLFNQYYAPLNLEVEHMFNQLVTVGEQVDQGSKTVQELEVYFDHFSYENKELTDIQEHWLGGLKKLAKKAVNVVKKGVSKVGKVVAKYGFGFLFNKLKKIALDFLKGFLAKGINMLPGQFKGIAQGLAQKIIPNSVPQAPSANDGATIAADDIPQDLPEAAQEEFNAGLAYLLTADNEVEWELIEREMNNNVTFSSASKDGISAARQEFVNQLAQVDEGEDVEPKVEQFVQVVLTGLKFVLPIVGRQRVMNWLSSLIAKLISKFIGKENAALLSKKMVESGFKLLNLEVTPEQSAQIGAGAIAAAVEDTVQQLETFPSYVFEDRQLFERYVVEAFEQAAAANFPDVLNEDIYQKNPWLRESNRKDLLWKFNKLKKHDHSKNSIKVKQLNEVIETELTPYIAEEVRTFGGIPLATFLRDRMGVTVNRNIPVRVHLLEALPGSRLYDLAKYNAGTQGIGATPKEAKMQYHPLTSIAAGLLLREPGLGCRKKKCLKDGRNASGHRYYYLEIPGATPQYFPAASGRPILRRVTELGAKLDFLANEIRLNLFLSEADAQAVAINLRRNQYETSHLLLMMTLEDGLKNLFTYGGYGGLKIVHPQVIPGRRSGLAMEVLPPVIVNSLKDHIKNWVGQNLISYLRSKANEFVQTAEDYADGVTIKAIILSPSDFSAVRQMLTGAAYTVPEAIFSKAPADVLFRIKPGYSYE